jgi:GT2 family glycosyltransferase
MEVAFILVNFHKAARAVESIRSLSRQEAACSSRFVVLDNSVSKQQADILRAEVEQVNGNLVVAAKNLGYVKGINLGAQIAGAFDYLVLVSPDIIVEETNVVKKMVSLMETDASIGVLGTIQYNDDGSTAEIARRFPSPIRMVRRRLSRGAKNDLDLLQPLASEGSRGIIDVDWVQSSFVMIRRSLWDTIEGLNERYFVFMADVDLCLRAHERGMRVALTSAVKVRADGVRASRGGILDIFLSKALRFHIRDAILYFLHNGLVPRKQREVGRDRSLLKTSAKGILDELQ